MIADDFIEIARRLTRIGKQPPPAPSCSIVYFDSKANTLTPDAHSIIQGIAEHIVHVKPTAVRCVGHTDSVGDLTDNQVLGMQRALIVRSWLHLRGVPSTLITCFSEGARKPRVPTAQGVGEGENRRVEVELE